MIRCDFLSRGSANCKRSVNGLCRDVRVVDQNVGRCWRRRRMHRRCIGCGEHTRQAPLHELDRRERAVNRSANNFNPPSSGSAGIASSRPAVRFSTARRARLSQCWPPLRRPPAGLGIDRPSTVLRLQKAVAIIGAVPLRIFLLAAAIVARQGRDPRLPARDRAGFRGVERTGPPEPGRAAQARRPGRSDRRRARSSAVPKSCPANSRALRPQ